MPLSLLFTQKLKILDERMVKILPLAVKCRRTWIFLALEKGRKKYGFFTWGKKKSKGAFYTPLVAGYMGLKSELKNSVEENETGRH